MVVAMENVAVSNGAHLAVQPVLSLVHRAAPHDHPHRLRPHGLARAARTGALSPRRFVGSLAHVHHCFLRHTHCLGSESNRPESSQFTFDLDSEAMSLLSILRVLAGYLPFLGRLLPAEEGGEEEEAPPLPAARVAVIGAGVGGCSAAYFLRERGGEAVRVDVFEKGEVGGRAATHTFRDHTYETGASIIHTSNKYLVNFSKEFGEWL